MDKKTLQDGALGYAFAMIVVAFLLLDEKMTQAQSLWVIAPASAVMLFQALRYARSGTKVAS